MTEFITNSTEETRAKAEEIAKELGTTVLGKIPMDAEVAKAADEGAYAGVLSEHLDDAIVAVTKL